MEIQLADLVPSDSFLVDASGQTCQLFRTTLNVLRSPADRSPLTITVQRPGHPEVRQRVAHYQLPTFGLWLPFTKGDAGKVRSCTMQVRCGEHRFSFLSALAFGQPSGLLLRLDRLNETFTGKGETPPDNPFAHTSFFAEVPAYLGQHNVVYHQPVTNWMDGQVAGNGDLVAVIFNHGPVVLHLNKCDLWAADETGRGLGRISAAHLRLGASFIRGTGKCSQVMRLADGTVETHWQSDSDGGALTTRSWIAPEANLLVTEVEGISPGEAMLRLCVERETLPPKTMLKDGGRDGNEWRFLHYEMDPWLQVSTHERAIVLRHELPNMSYAVACGVEGTEAEAVQEERETGAAGSLKLRVKGSFRFALLTAVVTSLESRSPCESAMSLVKRYSAKNLDKLHAEQRRFWESFWSRSFVRLDDDPFLENLWYVSLYHMACVSRGKVAPAFLGSWWGEDLVPWFDQYVSDSQCQLDHWLCFSSNHLELARPFHRTYGNLMRYFLAHGPEGGLAVPHMFFPEHGMLDLSDSYRVHYASSAPWLFQTFLWQYEYTGDEDYLRDFLYPVLKATGRTLKATALRRDRLGAVHADGDIPEQVDTATDNPMNLFLVRMTFTRLIEFSRQLKVDAAERGEWKDLLDNLADYPQDEKCIWEAKEQAHPFRKHPSVFFPLFPGMELASEDPLAAKFRCTLDRALKFWASRYDCLYADGRRLDTGGEEPNGHSIFWIAAVAARLGDGRRALGLLYNPGLLLLLKPQGLLCHGGRKSHPWYRTGVLDATNSLVTAINEMLVQSLPDHFRVFPAVPDNWTASFARLRVRGPFLVSARRERGKVREVVVESERRRHCRLLNPWPSQAVTFEDLKGGSRRTLRGKQLQFQAAAGGAYRLTPKGSPPLERKKIPTGEARGSARLVPLRDLLARHGWQVIFPDLRHFQTTGQDVMAQNAVCLGLPPLEALPVTGPNPLAPASAKLRRLLKSGNWRERQAALAAMGPEHLSRFLPSIASALKDPQRLVRWTAAHKLSLFAAKESRVLCHLVKLLESPEVQQRWTALCGLRKVSSTTFGYDPAREPTEQGGALKRWYEWMGSQKKQ